MIREADLNEPTKSQAFEVSVITEPTQFAKLRGEWSALLEKSDAGIFNAWDWLYPWYRRVAPTAQPFVLTARDRQGTLVGVMPLMLETKAVATVKVRHLAFLGDRQVGSDYLDVVAVRGQEAELTRAFVQLLHEQRGAWDVLELNDFDERSGTPEVFREVFGAAGFEVQATERFLCPNETFAKGESFEAFLKRTKRRDNYLRRRKWLEKQEGYRIEIDTDPKKLTRPLSEFFRLHSMRWEEDGGSSGINGPRVESFHRDVTALFAEQGKLRLYTMWLGDTALASVYGIVHGETFHYYQAGYDPEWRNKSVGLVLVGATFEDALAMGLRHYDFLRGTEPYKADWVSMQRKTTGLCVYSKAGAGALYVGAEQAAKELRGVVKRLLPTNAVEKIRRFRRQRAAAVSAPE